MPKMRARAPLPQPLRTPSRTVSAVPVPDRRVQATGPAASLSRLSQDPVAMLSSPRLLGLVCLLTAPLAPGAAQRWIEPIRPRPAFPRGALVNVRGAVQVPLAGRAAR